MSHLITLTTDFGLRDPFVGIMKGVMLAINPEARLVDLTHQVESFAVLEGALALGASYPYFPSGTVHLVVVDPGVGSERRPILVSAGEARFVGPDNGVFSLVYRRESPVEVRHITAKRYFLAPVSQTFHGRDVFAPVAAWLSKNESVESFGHLITDYVRLDIPRPEPAEPELAGRGGVSQSLLRGAVLRVDKFGNLITNFTSVHLGSNFCLLVNGRRVTRLAASFASGATGEIFALVGSAGFIEIAARQASAAEMLGARAGAEVSLVID